MYKNLLDHDVLPYLYECAKKNDFAIVTYDGEYVLTEKPDDEYVLKEALLNVMKIKKVDNFLDAVKHPIAKCLIVGEPTRLAELEKEMYEHLKDRMGVFRSEPYFLELVPKGIDKAQSLAVLLKEIGLTREEMIAIGDGFNDLSMIQYAGLGIAMANAQEVVKENADFITLSNEEDGVAYAAGKIYSVLGFRSKNGFLDDALTGMAYTWVHPSSQSSCWAARPAENITRVSTRWSAATEQAEPMAIPTSTLLMAQGTPFLRSPQCSYPQCPQSSPCGSERVPISTTHSAWRMLSASRRKNFKTIVFVHLLHRIRKDTDVAFRHHGHFNNVYPLSFGSCTCRRHHLLRHLQHLFMTAVSFIQYHIPLKLKTYIQKGYIRAFAIRHQML